MPEIDEFLTGQLHRNVFSLVKDSTTGWFKGWYFDLRYREELERSRRYRLPMSLVCLRLHVAGDQGRIQERLSDLAQTVRSLDLMSKLDDRTIVLCLPHTDSDGAGVVMDRLTRALGDWQPKVGRATYPGDGDDAEALLAQAFNRAEYGPIAF